MFVVLVYDVQAAREARARKTALKYLYPVQKSVYEGQLSNARLKQLKHELLQDMDTAFDAAVIYRQGPDGCLQKELLGKCLEPDERFL